jgi:hypothetical protein
MSNVRRPSAAPIWAWGNSTEDRTITVTQCGRICIQRRRIKLSQVFVGQYVRIKVIAKKIWLVSFTFYDGFFGQETDCVELLQTRSAQMVSVFSTIKTDGARRRSRLDPLY